MSETKGRRRLSSIEFQTLRSIGREPWSEATGTIQWKFHRKWVDLYREEHWRYSSLIAKARDAAEELVSLGLVTRVSARRCCNDAACQTPIHDELHLSESGTLLLAKANAVPAERQSALPCPGLRAGQQPGQRVEATKPSMSMGSSLEQKAAKPAPSNRDRKYMKIMNLTVDRLHLALAAAALVASVAALALGYKASREKSASEDIVGAAIYNGIVQQQAFFSFTEHCHSQLWSMSQALPESVRQNYPVLAPLPLPRANPLSEDALAAKLLRTPGASAARFLLAEEIQRFQEEARRGLKFTAASTIERPAGGDAEQGGAKQQ